MTRRTRSTPEVNFVFEATASKLVSPFLKQEWWRMRKKCEEQVEDCPICTDSICCAKVMCLMTCGHHVCCECYMRMEERCPVCRK